MEIHLASLEAMYHQWHQLAQQWHFFLLNGELGAWKTTLAKWIAEQIGIDPWLVTSPTYTYVQTYNDTLLHVDMWRIESAEFIQESWILDLIQAYPYVIIERPKRTSLYANNQRLTIHITKKESWRDLTIENWHL
jgi:tRNA threonylcarbamoyl adenosine modification protein YjeE